MELKLGNRRLKMIDGKVYIVKFSGLGVEVKSGKFTPIKFSKHIDGYNQCGIVIDGRLVTIREHRLVYYAHNPDWDIWDASPDNQIDHINRKRDDNRIDNLHIVNNQQNNFNRSDVKGYYWCNTNNKWDAQIKLNGKSIHIGYFDNEEDAHNAYLEAKAIYHVIAAPPVPGHAAPTG